MKSQKKEKLVPRTMTKKHAKSTCPRAHFHRANVYCKACGTLIK